MDSQSILRTGQFPVPSASFFWLLRRGLAVVAMLLGAVPLLGTAQDAPSLFLADEGSQISRSAAPKAAERGIRRARLARINPKILADPASPLHRPSPAALKQPGSRLALGLFPDRSVNAVIERTDYLPGGRFSARGVVEGVPGSFVLISGNPEAMAATVQTPGADIAQIVYAGDGNYQIAELDPVESTTCGAISAPKPASGDGGGPVIPAGDASTTIDVMVLYTAAARRALTARSTWRFPRRTPAIRTAGSTRRSTSFTAVRSPTPKPATPTPT